MLTKTHLGVIILAKKGGKHVDKRLRILRKELDLTQQEFADRLGIKRNTIANYECGRNKPVGSVFSLICREFNINEEWLRNGTGEMFVKASTFSLDDYAKLHNLTEKDKEVIRRFMELDSDTRDAIYAIFKNTSDNSVYDNAPDDPQELENICNPVNNDVDTI